MEALKKLFQWVPGRIWLALAGLLVAAFWMQQHDAGIRRQAQLQQLRSQTSAQAAALRQQAAQDVKQANVENARAIAQLEQSRQQAVEQNRELAAQLSALRRQAQIQAAEVATLPISEITTRVAAQLGFHAGDVAGKEKASSRKGAKAQSKLQVTNDELQKPDATAGPADLNQRLCALCGPQDLTERAQRSSVSSVLEPFNSQSAQRRRKEQVTNDELQKPDAETARTADTAKNAASAPANDAAVLALTASGARKVEAALVELNACRAESGIETQQISTCQARAEADEAEVKRLNVSAASLNQALDAKDKILALQQTESQAEMRAARGTFLGRLARLAEHVAIGMAMGVAIGVAVK